MKDQKQGEIREMALFRGCSSADTQWIARVADTVDVPAGRTIARRGDTSREFIVIVRGTAANGDGTAVLGPGAYLGHMGLIDGRTHSRTVETLTSTRLLVFGAGAFRGMLDRIPVVGRKLLAEMVTQLRRADQPSRSLRAVS